VAKIKGVVFWVVALLLIIPAFAFKVDITPNAVSIPADGTAHFNVTIKNTESYFDQFRVFSLLYPDWDLRTDPIENPIIISLGPGEEQTKGIIVQPLHVFGIGTYILDVKVESEKSGIVVTVPRRVSLSSGPSEGKYVPTVTVNINMPEEVNPSKAFEVDLDIKNQNILSLENLKLIARSMNGLFYKEIDFSLGPKGRSMQTLTFELDTSTPPQKDTLSVEIKRGNETILSGVMKKINIAAYNEITQAETESSFFFKTVKTIIFENKGNVRYSGPATLEYPWISRIFITAEPEATFRFEGSKSLLEWKLDLEPGQSMNATVITNYRFVLYFILLLSILALLYAQYRSPLVLEKGASNIVMKEGGISEMKVVLTLKNRGKHPVKSITVSDKIPRIGHVKKGADIGTLHPSKVLSHEQKGTLLKWNVDHVEPAEERVIAYRITAGLPITGGIELPGASAKFNVGKRLVSTSSKPLRID